MTLRTLGLRPSYRSDEADIAAEFMVPCLTSSDRYDRGTGYFTSGILPLILRGLEAFARGSGRIRLVASPNLTADDVEQINQGYADRELVIAQRTDDAIDALAESDPTVYAQLAWLISHEVLDIRFALLRDHAAQGIYHEKFGIFSDDVDAVAFTGSLNETLAAIVGNFEYIDVFCSWSDCARVAEKRDYFERLWNGETPRLDVIPFSAALRAKLLAIVPTDYPPDLLPHEPERDDGARQLRPHQIEAIDAWRGNGRRGLLEMATGTGKTFTALSVAAEMLQSREVRTIVILAPYIAIADQWREEAEKIAGIVPVVCHSQSGDWKAKLRREIALSSFQSQQQSVIVALYDTASGEEFRQQAERLSGPIVLIADEVHNVTLDVAELVLLDRYDFRLGLSATPGRYLDEIGTERVRRYFDRIVFRYSLGDAIKAGALTPYDYYPVICVPRDSRGLSRLSGVNAAKFNRFTDTFTGTKAYSDGYALVYCQPPQLDETKEWLGITLGKHIHTFTAEEDLPQRRKILKDFGSGFYHLLVAMRCLDEGVDVPPTRSAFLLGSSENPKQFVQRRGRVLRKYPGKSSAAIYDFVYLPKPENKSHEDSLRKELTRFAEFALSARNSDEAFEIVIKAAESRGISLRYYIQQGV